MTSFICTAWLACRALLRLGCRTLGWSLSSGLPDPSVKWQGQGELSVGLRSLCRILLSVDTPWVLGDGVGVSAAFFLQVHSCSCASGEHVDTRTHACFKAASDSLAIGSPLRSGLAKQGLLLPRSKGSFRGRRRNSRVFPLSFGWPVPPVPASS